MNKDVVFAFIGGITMGAAGTIAVMKKLGYTKLAPYQRDILYAAESTNEEKSPKKIDQEVNPAVTRDESSFAQPSKLDTHKVNYTSARLEEKPDLDELAKKYVESEDESNEVELTEDEDEDDDAFEGFDEAPDDIYDEYLKTLEEEYGKIIMELTGRKDDLIFLIPPSDFGSVYLPDKLVYYVGDDILADTTDCVMDDPEHIVGDALHFFGTNGVDANKVYVRNATIQAEYEITRVRGSYADHLYGIDAEEEE